MVNNELPSEEQIKAEVESGQFTTFRKLLRQGIGSRTQGAFAEEAGISRSTVSKMLNLPTIPRPEKSTLEAVAARMYSVSYADLCYACGYPREDINDIAAKVKSSILDGSVSQRGALSKNGPEDFLDSIAMLYIPVDCTWRRWKVEENEIPDVIGEHRSLYICKWNYGDYSCSTFLAVGYSKTESGKTVLNDVRVDAACLLPDFRRSAEKVHAKYNADLACIMEQRRNPGTKSRESMLLESLMGNNDTYTQTEIGCGFYYHETPKNFASYLMAHAAAFCTTEENRKLYNEWTSQNKDADDVFSSFAGENGERGTGAVIAHILTVETGMPFQYARCETDDETDDSAVYCTEGIDQNNARDKIDGKLLMSVYYAACELGIEKFGKVYHKCVEFMLTDQVYSTKEFHYEFKEH